MSDAFKRLENDSRLYRKYEALSALDLMEKLEAAETELVGVKALHESAVEAWIATSKQRDELRSQLVKEQDFRRWVDSWVSNPVTSYSVHALDGLFGMTRDKIAALSLPDDQGKG